MKVAHSLPANKTEKLVDLAIELQAFVDQAAADGESLYETEKGILAKVLQMGHLAIDRPFFPQIAFLISAAFSGDERSWTAIGSGGLVARRTILATRVIKTSVSSPRAGEPKKLT